MRINLFKKSVTIFELTLWAPNIPLRVLQYLKIKVYSILIKIHSANQPVSTLLGNRQFENTKLPCLPPENVFPLELSNMKSCFS